MNEPPKPRDIMSETPRVDAEYDEGSGHEIHSEGENGEEVIEQAVGIEFARQLERELTQAQERCAEVEKAVLGECEECGRTIVTPLKHLPSVEKDAARYRWLRTRVANPYVAVSTQWGVQHIYGEPLDAAIDAALRHFT